MEDFITISEIEMETVKGGLIYENVAPYGIERPRLTYYVVEAPYGLNPPM